VGRKRQRLQKFAAGAGVNREIPMINRRSIVRRSGGLRLCVQRLPGTFPIQEYGGFDFEVESYGDGFTINFGLEPTYQYEPLLLYHIENDKDNCKTIKGKAQGVYGSNIEINKEIKYDNCDTEFKELIERWHKKLLEVA
jgi:hypothetical protein